MYLSSFLTPLFSINELLIGPANLSGIFVNVDDPAKSSDGSNMNHCEKALRIFEVCVSANNN